MKNAWLYFPRRYHFFYALLLPEGKRQLLPRLFITGLFSPLNNRRVKQYSIFMQPHNTKGIIKPPAGKKRLTIALILAVLFSALLEGGCSKPEFFRKHHRAIPANPASYPSEVINKWMALQVRLMKNANDMPNEVFSRHFAYSGIAAWESVAPGIPDYAQWEKKWNGLNNLPHTHPDKQYYWPASANAALAAMNRAMFTNATTADKAAIDSLENVLYKSFVSAINKTVVKISAQFGKKVAAAVYNWSETDGHQNENHSYAPPAVTGLWIPASTAYANAGTPYRHNTRPVVKGSTINTRTTVPVEYSTRKNSAFYKMVKNAYDVPQNLTAGEQATVAYWHNVPGATSPVHWLNILLQTVQQTNISLAKAAAAYALTGAAINDALVSCRQSKLHYNPERPIAYLRDVAEYSNRHPVLTIPLPEYPSAYASLSGAAAAVLESIFGLVHSFTDHTYDYLGYTPRTYSSFTAIAEEAAQSELYAGIHYRQPVEAGMLQGRKVAANIFKYRKYSFGF